MIGHLGVFNSDRNRFFSKKDLFKAHYLSTILSQNLRIQQLTRHSNGLDKLLKQIMGDSYTDVIVLDSNFKQVYWNERSPENSLSRYFGQYETGHINAFQPILPQYVIEECIKMRNLLRTKTSQIIDSRHLVLWTNQRQQINVEIIALPQEFPDKDNRCQYYFILILNHVHRSNSNSSTPTLQKAKLTSKEIDIARYICQGLTNKEISQKLFISRCTVATHVQHIFHKLGVQRRSQLIHQFLS